MYRLLYHPRTEKFFKKIPHAYRTRLFSKIDQLAHDPFAEISDVKKLAGTSRSYRLRVGTIRVIYEVDAKEKTIYIHEVGFRGGIY